MKLQDKLVPYLEYCTYRKELDQKTVKAYRIDLNQYFAFVACEEPDKEKIEEYITELHKKYKQKTVKRKIASVKAYSEWKSNQDTQPFNENVEKEYQKLLETLSPEQEEVLMKYCDEIFASGAETEEFFYRLGIKDGLRLKSTVKFVLEMMS